MIGRARPWALLALAALTTVAHAEGRGRSGPGPGRAAAPFVARGAFDPGAGRQPFAPGPARPPIYARPPSYGRPPGGYSAAPYEPPLAPNYAARPNSLGAQWAQQQDEARNLRRQGRILPLTQVLQTLQKLRPGRVLDAGLEAGPDGRAAYRVRWAAVGGRRIDFIVDAETGAIIGRGGE